MTVEGTDCIYYVPPSLTVYLYGLQSNLDYRVIVSDQDGVVDVWEVPAGTEGDTSFTWNDIPGGDYTATFEQAIIAGEWQQVVEALEISVVDCSPRSRASPVPRRSAAVPELDDPVEFGRRGFQLATLRRPPRIHTAL